MIDLGKEKFGFEDLVAIMARLRGPAGCPWDMEQTHESIRRNFIEEVYEACEAIDNSDPAGLCEELGDVLLQVVFHAEIARGENLFNIEDVCTGICKKLILRHPHIFGDVRADTPDQVLKNWEAIKRVEKKQQTHADALEAVAKSLPALVYAEKVQAKAAKAGFDWDETAGALDKVEEEARELREAVTQRRNMEEELGDLLFAAVNVARFIKADPEQTLVNATTKFIRRFSAMERLAKNKLDAMTLAEMDKLWNQVKESGL